jgi:hypothetical protein
MLIQIYCNEKTGAVLIPCSAKTEVGFWLDVEPVEVAHADNEASILGSLRKIAALGVRSVPTPRRDAFPKPVILKFAGSKTWGAFQKIHILVHLEQSAKGQFSVQLWERVEGRSYQPGPTPPKVFQQGTSLEDAASEVAQLIRCARNSPGPN